jgi:hypothetical protein
MHHITVVEGRRLVSFALSGFLDRTALESFELDLKRTVRELSAGGAHFDVLADLREMSVLAKTETDFSHRVMAWLGDNGLRKSASIVASTLIGLQTVRLADDERFRYFLSENDALAWLAD